MDDVVPVFSFDGQVVWKEPDRELFEVGNFLGGGAAGTVYECEHVATRCRYALKILNPLGFKLSSPVLLKKYSVLHRGDNFYDVDANNRLGKHHVSWLYNSAMKQYHACLFSVKLNCFKELSLLQCLDLWGNSVGPVDGMLHSGTGIPVAPPKYIEFLNKRDRIFREILNMRKISTHQNVIKLEGVLELTQESKYTVFLVMELANGGELFDRIKIDQGTKQDTAVIYLIQLLEGVYHCHRKGVCHRDLKPENLLLSDDGHHNTILKIADFGFSALVENDMSTASEKSPIRTLRSVVGSPFYVAPEVVHHSDGYDGNKADVWSIGVIYYAMLAGNLPFGQELSTCKRFRHFSIWCRERGFTGNEYLMLPSCDYPEWLFPNKFSVESKALLVGMLHPDPAKRITVLEALQYLVKNSPNQYGNKNSAADMDDIFEMEMENDDDEVVDTTSDIPKCSSAEPPFYPNADSQPFIDLFDGVDDNDEKDNEDQHNTCDYGRDRTVGIPAFNDMVKKASRFITTVAADEVLRTVESILLDVRVNNEETPIGLIRKVELNWSLYKLEVWSEDGAVACALQVFQMTTATMSCSLQQSMDNNNIFLVEFLRGQVDLFAFKRFYQWLRCRLSKIVKRDYAVSFFESQQSPIMESYMRNGFRIQN